MKISAKQDFFRGWRGLTRMQTTEGGTRTLGFFDHGLHGVTRINLPEFQSADELIEFRSVASVKSVVKIPVVFLVP
jgi:hypothetical protein